MFDRPVSVKNRRTGFSVVTSSASVFRTRAAAHASYATSRKRCRTKPYRIVRAESIGGEAVLCARTFEATPRGPAINLYFVFWRRGAVTASTATASLQGATAPEDTVALASKQDRRIRSVVGD
jgi:hypothetical protein